MSDKPKFWTEDHPGIWEAHQNGFDYVVTDDGNMTIHFGRQTEKDRVVLLIEPCRESINGMKRHCEQHANTVQAAIYVAVDACKERSSFPPDDGAEGWIKCAPRCKGTGEEPEPVPLNEKPSEKGQG